MAEKLLTQTRLVLWAAVAFVAIAAIGGYFFGVSRNDPPAPLGAGAYRLATADGQDFSFETLKGHPSMVFFGFTHCPEVCPTTMAEMASWYETLGDEAKDLKAYFVTVDPERDTAEIIGDYVAWTGHVTGVTGTRPEIDKAIAAWKVYAKKVPLADGEYNMDHTASVFLVGKDGLFDGTIAYREEAAVAVQKLRKLIGGTV